MMIDQYITLCSFVRSFIRSFRFAGLLPGKSVDLRFLGNFVCPVPVRVDR